MCFAIPRPLPFLIAAAAVAACSGGGTSPEGMGRVVFQIATSGTGSSNGPALADVVVSRGSNVVVVSQVQLVARKIRLRRVDASCVEDPEQDEDSHEADEEHHCPTLKLGPLLLEPPLSDGAVTSFTADVPVGTYSRVKLQIHKPRGNRDQAFLAAHPDLANVSIRVHGTFDGAPFTFDTGIEEEEEITFPSPIEVTTAGTASFTLFLDVRGWFLDQSGNALIDPTAPSTLLRAIIEHNIRSSFHAFRDDDHDGHDDDDHGHD